VLGWPPGTPALQPGDPVIPCAVRKPRGRWDYAIHRSLLLTIALLCLVIAPTLNARSPLRVVPGILYHRLLGPLLPHRAGKYSLSAIIELPQATGVPRQQIAPGDDPDDLGRMLPENHAESAY